MNLKVIRVHGVILGQGLADIPCNALCEPPTHCDVSYHTKPVAPFIKALRFALSHPEIEVMHVEHAPEAPATPGPSFFTAVSASEPPAGEHYAYLVRWRLRTGPQVILI